MRNCACHSCCRVVNIVKLSVSMYSGRWTLKGLEEEVQRGINVNQGIMYIDLDEMNVATKETQL